MQKSDLQKVAVAYIGRRSSGQPIDHTLRVTLNFHPDRQSNGIHILDAIRQAGIYRSQYETGTSNGGLTAHPGGDRWSWESRIYGTVYDGATPQDRPKYGALNYKKSPYGGSPRFGSSYFRLTEDCLERTTFCYPDSVFNPENFGVAAKMDLIKLAVADNKDMLDDYIEAQAHGSIVLSDDVEALVLDKCYRETDVEVAARKLPCKIEWHPGFKLDTKTLKLHPEYRGDEYVELGLKLAQDGLLDAKIIGDASRSGKYDQQALKRVWHYVARFGGVAPTP